MSNSSRSRGRAVRLTPPACEALRAALYDAHQRADSSSKLTREARANLLGVSVATSERILEGKGVDRPTLMWAFSRLRLDWDEGFCERVTAEVAHPVETVSAAPVVPVAKERKPMRRVAVVGFLALSVLVIAALERSKSPTPADNEASRNFHKGDFASAEVQIEKAISLAREHFAEGHLSASLRVKGDIAGAQGSFVDAEALYQEAYHLRTAFDIKRSEPAILEALGDLEVKTGDFTSAKAHLSRSLSMFRSFKDPMGEGMACRTLGALAMRQGDLKAAGTWYQSSLTAVRGLGKLDLETDVRGQQALILCERGRFDKARAQLQVCLRYWQSQPHPRWIAVTQLQLGTVEAKAGNPTQARPYLTQANEGFTKVGDRAGSAEATRWLKSLHSSP